MQIVIDISEEDFKIMKHNVAIGKPLCSLSEPEMVSKVANGIPLPKRHGNIIDTEVLIAYIRKVSKEQKYKELAIQEHLTVDDVFEAIIGTLKNASILEKDKVQILIPAEPENAVYKTEMEKWANDKNNV